MRLSVVAAFAFVPLAGLCIALSRPHIAFAPTDQRAGYVHAQRPGNRVIVIPPVLPAYLTAKQTAEKVIGAPEYSVEQLGQGLLRNVFPEASKISIVATPPGSALPPDAEQILSMQPDAVIFWSHLSAPFKKAGVPLALIDLDVAQSDAYFEDIWRRVGAVADAEGRVDQLIARYAAKRDQVLALVAQQHSHPKGLYLLRSEPLQVYTGQMRNAHLIEETGATNTAAKVRGIVIDKEMLIQFNPDIIFVTFFDEKGAVQRLINDPALQSVTAIRLKRVYREPEGGDRMQPFVEGAAGLDWLAELIYPDSMPRNFRAELIGAYQEAYGITLSDDDIDQALRLDENAGSAGYSRFLRQQSAGAWTQ